MDGVLNLHKPPSFTSHDVVAKVRGILREKRVGHLGTLDPLATGVLPLVVGAAARLAEFASGTKEYRAVCLLGRTTDSGDVTGVSLREGDALPLPEEKVRQAVLKLRDIKSQVPPMVSAVKKNGMKLYELDRKGVEVERQARPVLIEEVEAGEIRLPRVHFRVVCSAGTYVRELCRTLGEALGVGGCLEELERTRVGKFRLENSITLEGLREKAEAGRISEALLPAQVLVEDWPSLRLAEGELTDLRHGKKVGMKEGKPGFLRVLDDRGRLHAIGLVEALEDGFWLSPKKVFAPEGIL